MEEIAITIALICGIPQMIDSRGANDRIYECQKFASECMTAHQAGPHWTNYKPLLDCIIAKRPK